MVGMHSLVDVAGADQFILQVICHRLVVDAPAFILLAGIVPESPPTVFHLSGVEVAEGVHEAVVEPFCHPLPFFGQKSGRFFIALRVVDIDFRMGDIVVPYDDELRALAAQFLDPQEEIVEELHFHRLADFAGGTGWEIAIQQRPVAEVGAQDAALSVVLLDTAAFDDEVGFLFGKRGHAAVALLLSRVPILLVSELFEEHGLLDLRDMRLGFLNADNVESVCFQPVVESLDEGRPDAVEVVGDDGFGHAMRTGFGGG